MKVWILGAVFSVFVGCLHNKPQDPSSFVAGTTDAGRWVTKESQPVPGKVLLGLDSTPTRFFTNQIVVPAYITFEVAVNADLESDLRDEINDKLVKAATARRGHEVKVGGTFRYDSRTPGVGATLMLTSPDEIQIIPPPTHGPLWIAGYCNSSQAKIKVQLAKKINFDGAVWPGEYEAKLSDENDATMLEGEVNFVRGPDLRTISDLFGGRRIVFGTKQYSGLDAQFLVDGQISIKNSADGTELVYLCE